MDQMNISPEEVKDRKKIGTLDGDDVYRVSLRGGLQMVAAKRKSGKVEVLGAASHKAIALHIAKKKNSNLKIDELAKGDFWPAEAFASELPKWERVTEEIRRRANGE